MERLIHIVPLGWEFDRAVLPVRQMHAHKVYLLCNPESIAEQRHFYEMVRSALLKLKVEVELVKVDANADLKGVMREVARLVRTETAKKNRVYVNMSAAGKIAAAAATIAAMAHLSPRDGMVYYVTAESYSKSPAAQRKYGLGRGMRGDPVPLPLFELRLPKMERQILLVALASRDPPVMTYKEVLQLLRERKIRGFENAQYESKTPRDRKNRLNVALNKRVLQQLVQDRLIEVEAVGRSRSIHLTGAGEYVASLCALPSGP